MLTLQQLQPEALRRLPRTCHLLAAGQFAIHPAVTRITLHGSRGLQADARDDSDIDLCLIVDSTELSIAPDRHDLLRQVLETTLQHWRSPIPLDLAAVLDVTSCGLQCLTIEQPVPDFCPFAPRRRQPGCMGVFKIQHGFHGPVPGNAIDICRMYPLIELWRRCT